MPLWHKQVSMQNSTNSQSTDLSFGSLKIYSSAVSCGFPSPSEGNFSEHLSLDELIIKKPTSTFFVRSIGDSMEPFIESGDLLVVDRSLHPVSSQVVLVVAYGEFSVKRIFFEQDMITLIPDNPKYRKASYKSGDEVEVWGVVTTVIKNALKSSLR